MHVYLELSDKVIIFVYAKGLLIMTDIERKQKQDELKELKRQIADKKLDSDIAKAKETLRIANMTQDEIEQELREQIEKKQNDTDKKKGVAEKTYAFFSSYPDKDVQWAMGLIIFPILIILFIFICRL